jgi:hypothetical protein
LHHLQVLVALQVVPRNQHKQHDLQELQLVNQQDQLVQRQDLLLVQLHQPLELHPLQPALRELLLVRRQQALQKLQLQQPLVQQQQVLQELLLVQLLLQQILLQQKLQHKVLNPCLYKILQPLIKQLLLKQDKLQLHVVALLPVIADQQALTWAVAEHMAFGIMDTSDQPGSGAVCLITGMEECGLHGLISGHYIHGGGMSIAQTMMILMIMMTMMITMTTRKSISTKHHITKKKGVPENGAPFFLAPIT